MRVDFTIAQYVEMFNPFWDISYTVDMPDGSTFTALYSDDVVREIPLLLDTLGQPSEVRDANDVLTGYANEHPNLTTEDITLIKFELDWRATKMATIAALPAADRAAARTALRTEIRQAARVDARRASRVALRVADRVAARQAYRAALRVDAVAAGVLPA